MKNLVIKSITAFTVAILFLLASTTFAGEKVLKLASFVPPDICVAQTNLPEVCGRSFHCD